MDMEASTQAVELLEKEIVRIKARRGRGGILNEKEDAIRTLKQELRRYNNSLETVGKNEKWMKDEEENW